MLQNWEVVLLGSKRIQELRGHAPKRAKHHHRPRHEPKSEQKLFKEDNSRGLNKIIPSCEFEFVLERNLASDF